jgi:hypothetical protein
VGQAVTHVAGERLQRAGRVHVVDVLANARSIPEFAECGLTRLLRRHAAREVVVDLDLQIGLEPARSLGIPARAPKNRVQLMRGSPVVAPLDYRPVTIDEIAGSRVAAMSQTTRSSSDVMAGFSVHEVLGLSEHRVRG